MPKATKRATKARPVPSSNLQINIPVPQDMITVTDLQSLSVKELNDLLERAKTARIGFVILNAPFKVRQVDPVS